MDIHTKEFWETVKREYNPVGNTPFICNSSPTFKDEWNSNSTNIAEIVKLAYEFITEMNLDGISVGWMFLFFTPNSNPATVRVQFIDWCIDKFSKS